MEFNLELDSELENHINKCRCCFNELNKNDILNLIDEKIQKDFLALTGLKLIKTSQLSSHICITCSTDLENYSSFRSSLILKQSKLYELVKPDEIKNDMLEHPSIKKEIDDDEDFRDDQFYVEPLTELKPDEDDEIKINTTDSLNYCFICQVETSSLRRHVNKMHIDVKNFYCDSCDFSSFFKSDLQMHMKTHSVKTSRKTYFKEPHEFYCEACGLKFFKKFHLNAHVKAKHTEKVRSHICNVCGKGFYSSENLKKHVESHNQKQLPCEYCGKLFSCINNLRTHLYYHSEPRFSCEFAGCDKKFFMRKRLRSHMNAHLNQKNHLCNYCEKGYFTQNDLNRHIFSIHQKLRFFCAEPGCQGNFSRREYYRKHCLTHHQNIGPERLENLLQQVKEAIPVQGHK